MNTVFKFKYVFENCYVDKTRHANLVLAIPTFAENAFNAFLLN